MDRRFRVRRKGKLEGSGNADRKIPSSTVEKLEGGTSTDSFPSLSRITHIASNRIESNPPTGSEINGTTEGQETISMEERM